MPPEREEINSAETKPNASERSEPMPTPLEMVAPAAAHYDELLLFSTDPAQLLRNEMSQLAKEISMLLQIVIDDYDTGEPIDPVFFSELRASVDSLRAVMYHLQHQADQQQTA